MEFDFYVHGLWLLGSVTMLLGGMMAGNLEWVEGTTAWSYGISILIAFILILFSGVCWISAAVNANKEMR